MLTINITFLDNDECIGKIAKCDSLSPPNLLTDRYQNLQRWLSRGCLPKCKISSMSDKWFRFCACATLRCTLLVFLWGGEVQLSTAKTTHRFWRKIRQKTFSAGVCLLGVSLIWYPFRGSDLPNPQFLEHEWAFSRQTHEILKLSYYRNRCINHNQILHNDKNQKVLFVGGREGRRRGSSEMTLGRICVY